jgi:hypothetical protein
MSDFAEGITPVLTIFYPKTSSSNSSLAALDVSLTCLKVVFSSEGMTTDSGQPSKPSAAAGSPVGNILALTLALFIKLVAF